MKICVLGAGAWGTALAIHLGKKHPTALWARNSGHVSGMKKAQSNPLYLGDFKFPSLLGICNDLKVALFEVDLIVCAVPTSGFRQILKLLNELINHRQLYGLIKVWNKALLNYPTKLLLKS